jgi:hypothetical protein
MKATLLPPNEQRYFDIAASTVASGAGPEEIQAAIDQAIERSNKLEAVLHNSGILDRLELAQLHDEIVERDIDALGTAIGLIPIPGSTGVSFIITAGITAVTEIGGTAWTESLYQYDTEVTEVLTDRRDTEAAIAVANVVRVYEIMGLDVPPPPSTEGSAFDEWLVARGEQISTEDASYNFQTYLQDYRNLIGVVT